MADYSAMTDSDFASILHDLVDTMSAAQILATPGVYEMLSDYFNNEVVEIWEAWGPCDHSAPHPAPQEMGQ